MKYSKLLSFVMFSIFLGCDASNGPNENSSQPKNEFSNDGTVDIKQYSSSLSDGINFSKDGYPIFISNVSGVSGGMSAWGRWTDDTVAVFKFKEKLPKKFKLILSAFPSQSLANKMVYLKVGGEEKTILMGDALTAKTFEVEFNSPDQTDMLSIIMNDAKSPSELDPTNPDKRILGLGLLSLSIKLN